MLRTVSEPDLSVLDVEENESPKSKDKKSPRVVVDANLRGEPGSTKRFIRRSLQNVSEIEQVSEGILFYRI